jgi:adenylosuccinate lyase
MAQVWSEEHKFDTWLRVEVAVCEAWAEQGVIPKEAVDKIRRARYDLERVLQYQEEMHHELNSFLRSVADSLGEESRFVHLGLTSYDVQDTALGLLLAEAAEILERDVEASSRTRSVWAALTASTPSRPPSA